MRGRQDKESYWRRVTRLKIYTEKSLGRERSNSLALSWVVPPFACFLPQEFVRQFLQDGLSERGTTRGLIIFELLNRNLPLVYWAPIVHQSCFLLVIKQKACQSDIKHLIKVYRC